MLKVVLDTNVIVSGIITDHGVPFDILEKWRKGEFLLVLSKPILKEIERVLNYPKIKKKRHLTKETIQNVLVVLRKYSLTTPADTKLKVVLKDPTDNKFIIAAVESNADYIVSGDKHLKDIGCFQNIRIISPVEFLQTLST